MYSYQSIYKVFYCCSVFCNELLTPLYKTGWKIAKWKRLLSIFCYVLEWTKVRERYYNPMNWKKLQRKNQSYSNCVSHSEDFLWRKTPFLDLRNFTYLKTTGFRFGFALFLLLNYNVSIILLPCAPFKSFSFSNSPCTSRSRN